MLEYGGGIGSGLKFGLLNARFEKTPQPDSFTPAWVVMAFRMTGIAPADAMVTLLAAFAERYTRALQPCSFTSRLPTMLFIALRMAWMPPASVIGTMLASSLAKVHNAMQARTATLELLG